MNLLGGFSHLLWYVGLVLGVVGVFAFVDAAIRPSGAYVAAGKLTKPAWLAILGVAILLDLLRWYTPVPSGFRFTKASR